MDYIKMIFNDYLVYIISFISCVLSILYLSSALGKNKILQWVGKSSLVIFALSEPIKRAVIFVVAKIFQISIVDIRSSIVWSLLVVTIVVLIFWLISNIVNNKLYFLIGKAKANK